MARDKVFQEPRSNVREFVFDEEVAGVFDNMIFRSVPLYQEVQEAGAKLAARFVQPGSSVYDLGCSTGASLLAMSRTISDPTVTFIGVDSSAPMLERCRSKLDDSAHGRHFELIEGDIAELPLKNASVIILNYTLQFLKPDTRLPLLTRIHSALRPGGALLLTEKVRHEEPQLQEVLTELYYDFKRKNGYSELEISQKRDALENVLIPFTAQENESLLRKAGFRTVEPYLKWYTFVSLIAIR